jgi:hypothetical protein
MYQQGSTFNNYGSLNFAYIGESSQISGSTSSFNNYGTIYVNSSSYTLTFSITTNNNGVMNILSGTAILYDGGDSTGTFNISAGALLDIGAVWYEGSSPLYTMEPTSLITGSGTAAVNGGSYNNIMGSVTVANFQVSQGTGTIGPLFADTTSVILSSGATLGINGTINIVSGVSFQLNGGTIIGPGTLIFPPVSTLSITGNPTLGGYYYNGYTSISSPVTINANGTSTFTM